MSSSFYRRLSEVAERVEVVLEELLGSGPHEGEIARPPRLMAAMRHATLAGGKRFRPFLVVEGAALFGVEEHPALLAGAAIECIHCYSLVHDDLPAMDDDDVRRGRPTVHKAFDEATAILAGDGLLTLAFDIASRAEVAPDPAVRLRVVSVLARASGIGGMVGGQVLDLAAEGRFDGGAPLSLGNDDVVRLQEMKTGALLTASCEIGALLGDADTKSLDALRKYGAAVGRAFQVRDDLLDLEGDPARLGKATMKDSDKGKATLVSVHGATWARGELERLVAVAEDALAPFGRHAALLREAARFVATRDA
jgi:farnesyl diphosphate synthase